MGIKDKRKLTFLKVIIFSVLLGLINLPAYSQIFNEAEDFVEMNGVQTENTSDLGKGQNVGWIDDGDWMEYDINIPVEGNYIISVRVASEIGGGVLGVINNGNSLGNFNIPSTGGWQNWQTVKGGEFILEAGIQRVRLLASTGGFNLNWFEIRLSNPVDNDLPTPPNIVNKYSNENSVSIYWNSSNDATTPVTGYKIYNNGNFVAFTRNNSIKLNNLLPEKEYVFDIYAYDLAGNKSPSTQVIASTTSSKRELVWFDEFDGTQVDQNKWNFQVGGNGWGNGEAQYYTNGTNSSVSNGNLIIEARKETIGSNNYTSSRMNTSGKGDFLYGRIEVKAKLPRTGGTWPAIWTLPTEWVYGNWPNAGEIDIMEHTGNSLNYVFGTIHTGAYNHLQDTQKSGGKVFSDVVNTYHTYALEWYPDHLDWYYDDELIFSFNNEYKTFAEWPFDVPHHLILNVAVGGGLGGVINHDGEWPQQMMVDYVRVYDFKFGDGDTIAPSSPTNMQAKVEGLNVELSWNKSMDNEYVDKYYIYQDGVLIDSTSRLSYIPKNLDPSTAYTFSVQAKDFAENFSNQVSIEVTTENIQPITIPGKIEAENFVYMEGMVTETCTDVGGGLNMAYIDEGDFLEYYINVPSDGSYYLHTRAASQLNKGKIELINENEEVLVTVETPITGGWQTWKTVISDGFNLTAGTQRIRIKSLSNQFNINWFEIASQTNSGNGFLKAEGKKIIDANGEEVLLRGMGPGGWQIMEGYMMQTSGFAGSQHEIKEKLIDLMGEANTETFFNKWRENHFTKRDVDSLAAWGFNSIRIPMHYNLFTLPIEEEPIAGENTWIETGFELIDNVLEWAAPYSMYVILDMHATPGGQGRGSEINDYDPTKPSLWESQENKDKLVALWTRIADRYKDNPWIGGYDLINETHWDLPGNTALRNLYDDITEGIRSVDSNHILFIEGNWYANDFNALTPAWDDNMVYSFHKYWSYNDTASIQWVLDLRNEHNVPLWMGEAGENSNTWFTDAITLFENNNIGWAWWTMRKIGDIDSPYAVDINQGYQKVIDYWKGEGPRPTEQETFDAMMQLAENLLVDNSSYRKDVPDAIIRQVQTNDTRPYHGTPTPIPGIVYASDFDLGKNNHAYYDTDVADYNLSTGGFQAWNKGWSYRNDGVDIEKNSETSNSNGFNIGFVNKGEWTKYTVQIDETAAYKATFRLATQENGGEFYLSLDDQAITSIQTVSSTGGWTQYTTFEVSHVLLTAGEHSLKLHFNNDIPFNVTSMSFEKTGEVNDVALNALNGNTGENEKSIEITISEALLASSLDGTLNQFTVFVNGEERVITSIAENPSKDRTFILTLDKYLIKSDDIKVSYSGAAIQSQSGKTLNTFIDLPINNESPDRVVIPGLIQVEDYDYMIGLGIEDTTDEGGGQNLGFTDPGDYADYSIFVPQSGHYGIKFRVAGLNVGQIGLYSVDENDVETELVVVNTVITNGWQTWVTTSDNVFIEEGIHTLRMKILSGGFNLNWIEFDYPDSDGDGVLDDDDLCPNTIEGATVDVNGCELFTIPADNYVLTISSETCRSQNNGSINIIAIENYDYSVTLTGENYSETKSFTSEIGFEGLSAGTYTLCITIIGVSNYEQCFTIIVTEPDELSVSTTDKNGNTKTGKVNNSKNMTVSLSGGELYYVTLNNKTIITSESIIELELVQGVNTLSVKTNKDCQGIYNETIMLNSQPIVFPNPIIDNTINISSANFYENDIPVEIYDLTGKLLFSKTYHVTASQLKIDVSTMPKGIYLLKIASNGNTFNYKIIK